MAILSTTWNTINQIEDSYSYNRYYNSSSAEDFYSRTRNDFRDLTYRLGAELSRYGIRLESVSLEPYVGYSGYTTRANGGPVSVELRCDSTNSLLRLYNLMRDAEYFENKLKEEQYEEQRRKENPTLMAAFEKYQILLKLTE